MPGDGGRGGGALPAGHPDSGGGGHLCPDAAAGDGGAAEAKAEQDQSPGGIQAALFPAQRGGDDQESHQDRHFDVSDF